MVDGGPCVPNPTSSHLWKSLPKSSIFFLYYHFFRKIYSLNLGWIQNMLTTETSKKHPVVHCLFRFIITQTVGLSHSPVISVTSKKGWQGRLSENQSGWRTWQDRMQLGNFVKVHLQIIPLYNVQDYHWTHLWSILAATFKTCQWIIGLLGFSIISAQCFFSSFFRL